MKMSDSSLNRVAYVKFMTASDVAKYKKQKEDLDCYGQLKNFGYGGFLYQAGKMTHDSSVKFEELLKKMKLSSGKSSSSTGPEDKNGEAEKSKKNKSKQSPQLKSKQSQKQKSQQSKNQQSQKQKNQNQQSQRRANQHCLQKMKKTS